MQYLLSEVLYWKLEFYSEFFFAFLAPQPAYFVDQMNQKSQSICYPCTIDATESHWPFNNVLCCRFFGRDLLTLTLFVWMYAIFAYEIMHLLGYLDFWNHVMARVMVMGDSYGLCMHLVAPLIFWHVCGKGLGVRVHAKVLSSLLWNVRVWVT